MTGADDRVLAAPNVFWLMLFRAICAAVLDDSICVVAAVSMLDTTFKPTAIRTAKDTSIMGLSAPLFPSFMFLV